MNKLVCGHTRNAALTSDGFCLLCGSHRVNCECCLICTQRERRRQANENSPGIYEDIKPTTTNFEKLEFVEVIFDDEPFNLEEVIAVLQKLAREIHDIDVRLKETLSRILK